MDKLDKIIELLEAIKKNQEMNQYHYYPPIYYLPWPQPYIPPEPTYPQPNWTYMSNNTMESGDNIYLC